MSDAIATVPVAPAPSDVPAGRLFIDGGWCDAASGETFDVHYPGTGEVLTRCAEAGEEDVDRAVGSARRGFEVWSSMSPAERGARVRRLGELLGERREEMARLTTLEMGKPASRQAHP